MECSRSTEILWHIISWWFKAAIGFTSAVLSPSESLRGSQKDELSTVGDIGHCR